MLLAPVAIRAVAFPADVDSALQSAGKCPAKPHRKHMLLFDLCCLGLRYPFDEKPESGADLLEGDPCTDVDPW